MSTEADPRAAVAPARVAPLVPLALAVVMGIIVDRYAAPLATKTWLLLALGFAPVSYATSRRRWVGALATLVTYGSLAAGFHHGRWSDLPANDLARGAGDVPSPAWVRGVIDEVLGFKPGIEPGDKGYTRAVLELDRAYDGETGWQSVSGRAILGIVGDRSDLRVGDAVEAAGNLALVAGPLNPGEFDYRAYLLTQGIRLKFSVDASDGVWTQSESTRSPRSWTWPFRRAIGLARAWSLAKLTEGLDHQTAPLAAALLLGRREGVEPDVNDAFARTGTTHLLAISGLHMQVLAIVLGGILRIVGVPRRTSFVAVGSATVAYMLLVGLMPSVVRSAAMTVTYCLAGFVDRPSRSTNTFAMAALVTLGLNPAHLFDVGCQLSFLAVGAIVWCAGPIWDRLNQVGDDDPLDALERKYAAPWKTALRTVAAVILQGVVISVIVWLVALPLAALRFHIVSPIAILLNVPLIPITSLALLACGGSLGLSAVWGPLGRPAAWANATLLGWTEQIVRWGASLRWGHWFVAEPPWGWVLAFYLSLLLATAAARGRWPGRTVIAGSFVVCVAVGLVLSAVPSLTARSSAAAPQAEVLAVGHGLAVVIDTGGSHAVLFDCGKMRDPFVGRRVIAPALWSRGIRRLDAVILSHADADHYNGLPDLLDRFPIAAVFVPEGFAAGKDNPGTAELLDLARSRGATIRHVSKGESWSAGETHFLVRHPPVGWNSSVSDNARSIVLDIGRDGRHVVLTGDLDGEGLLAFTAAPQPWPVDVMLSPHHGGKTANPLWLYEKVSPSLVVVSQRPPVAGSRDALSMLESRDLPVMRSWREGAIRLSWTQEGVVATGFLDGQGRRSETTSISDIR